jgi:hypothetical protein
LGIKRESCDSVWIKSGSEKSRAVPATVGSKENFENNIHCLDFSKYWKRTGRIQN